MLESMAMCPYKMRYIKYLLLVKHPCSDTSIVKKVAKADVYSKVSPVRPS